MRPTQTSRSNSGEHDAFACRPAQVWRVPCVAVYTGKFTITHRASWVVLASLIMIRRSCSHYMLET